MLFYLTSTTNVNMFRIFFLLCGAHLLHLSYLKDQPLSHYREKCEASCSEDVNCTCATSGLCVRGKNSLSSDLNIPGEPFHIKFYMVNSSEEQYSNFHLSWNLPLDGSRQFLSGFLAEFKIYGNNGHGEHYCFELNLGANWTEKLKSSALKKGATVFLDCIQMLRNNSSKIEIFVYSLPFNSLAPKAAREIISFKIPRWKPKLDLYTDEPGTVYIELLNPLNCIKRYHFTIYSITEIGEKFIKQFSLERVDNKTEQSDGTENNLSVKILLTGVNSEDEFKITMDVYDDTGKHLLDLSTYETNFTFKKKTESEEGIDDNRFIIILVTLCTAVVASLLLCVLWRGKIWLKIRKWMHSFSHRGPVKNSRMKLPKIFPVYCFENANYVNAVECHISILQQFVDISKLPSSKNFLCEPGAEDYSWLHSEIKNSNILIYLSPKFRELLIKDIDISDLCHLDLLCFHSIQALHDILLSDSSNVPCIVTFDCFEDRDLESLRELQEALPLHSSAETPLVPLKLASCDSNTWQLENLEQLLHQLYKASNSTSEFSQNLSGLKQCQEAVDLQKYLTLLTQPMPAEESEKLCFTIEDQKRSSLRNGVALLPSEKEKLCSSDTVFLNNLKNPEVQSTDINAHLSSDADVSSESTEPTSRLLLISNSSGFQSGSYETYDEEFQDSVQPPADHCVRSFSSKPMSHPRETVHLYNDRPFLNISVDNVHNTDLDSPTNSYRTIQNLFNVYPHKDVTSTSYQSSDCDLTHQSKHSPPAAPPGKFDAYWTVHNGQAICRPPAIIPPSLCFSNSTSIDSVCERINKVNENSVWSDLNLAK